MTSLRICFENVDFRTYSGLSDQDRFGVCVTYLNLANNLDRGAFVGQKSDPSRSYRRRKNSIFRLQWVKVVTIFGKSRPRPD